MWLAAGAGTQGPRGGILKMSAIRMAIMMCVHRVDAHYLLIDPRDPALSSAIFGGRSTAESRGWS
jgi:hypothetical protein